MKLSTDKREIEAFWDSRPCNIAHSNKAVGSRDYFNDVERRKYFVEPHIPEFAAFKNWKEKTVLEIGCGIGTDAINFARARARYTGIELSSKSLELTRVRFQLFGLKGEVYHHDAESLDKVLKNRTFDLVYSFGILHHTPNIERALYSIKSVMNHDSCLKIMLYARNSWKQAMIDSGLDQPEAQKGCPIANSYTKEQVRKLLENNGFKLVNITQTHIFPYKVTEYKEHKYVKQDWFEKMPPDVFRALEKSFGWHLLIDSKLS